MIIQPQNPLLIELPMPIRTPRLTLRPAMPGDGATVHAAKEESWDDLTPWMSWAKTRGPAEQDEIVVRESYAKFIRREDIMLLAFENATGDFIGGTGLHNPNWKSRQFEIGYWIRKSKQRRGYAFEITNALLRYGFGALSATRMAITHAGRNEASAAVIKKAGFTPEGILRHASLGAMKPDGRGDDLHIYSRLDLHCLDELEVHWSPP